MNDFTKEELETILNWGESYTEFGQSWTYEPHKPLLSKIKTIIDNFNDCKHKNTDDCKCCNTVKCDDCGEVW